MNHPWPHRKDKWWSQDLSPGLSDSRAAQGVGQLGVRWSYREGTVALPSEPGQAGKAVGAGEPVVI